MYGRDLPGLKNTKEWKLGADGYAFSSDNLIVRNTKEETHEMDKDWREDIIEKKNLRSREGDRERGRGSWIGELSWCRDGGVATDERRGGAAS